MSTTCGVVGKCTVFESSDYRWNSALSGIAAEYPGGLMEITDYSESAMPLGCELAPIRGKVDQTFTCR